MIFFEECCVVAGCYCACASYASAAVYVYFVFFLFEYGSYCFYKLGCFLCGGDTAVSYGETYVGLLFVQPLGVGEQFAAFGEVNEVGYAEADEAVDISASQFFIGGGGVFSCVDSVVDLVGVAYGGVDGGVGEQVVECVYVVYHSAWQDGDAGSSSLFVDGVSVAAGGRCKGG